MWKKWLAALMIVFYWLLCSASPPWCTCLSICLVEINLSVLCCEGKDPLHWLHWTLNFLPWDFTACEELRCKHAICQKNDIEIFVLSESSQGVESSEHKIGRSIKKIQLVSPCSSSCTLISSALLVLDLCVRFYHNLFCMHSLPSKMCMYLCLSLIQLFGSTCLCWYWCAPLRFGLIAGRITRDHWRSCRWLATCLA